MAAPTYVAKTTLRGFASGTSHNLTIPAHLTNDIIVVMGWNSGGQSISPSAGWVEAGYVSNANMAVGVWWKRAASAGQTCTLTYGGAASGSIGHAYWVYVIRGCRTSGNPFNGVSFIGPTSTNKPVWGPITAGDQSFIFASAIHEGAWPSWSNSVLSGYTEREQNSYYGGSENVSEYTISRAETSGGASIAAGTAFVNSPGTKSTTTYAVTVAFALESIAAPPSSRLKRWNGSAWVVATLKQGASWTVAPVKKF